jgi:hypothetical protein
LALPGVTSNYFFAGIGGDYHLHYFETAGLECGENGESDR